MKPYSEIVESRLWAGNLESVRSDIPGVQCVLSIFPVATSTEDIRYSINGKKHHILVAGDYNRIPPADIDSALDSDLPMLIHCNAGQNRSTALATCWLLRHGGFTDAAFASAVVLLKRAEDLGIPPRMTDVMWANIEEYAIYLSALKETA